MKPFLRRCPRPHDSRECALIVFTICALRKTGEGDVSTFGVTYEDELPVSPAGQFFDALAGCAPLSSSLVEAETLERRPAAAQLRFVDVPLTTHLAHRKRWPWMPSCRLRCHQFWPWMEDRGHAAGSANLALHNVAHGMISRGRALRTFNVHNHAHYEHRWAMLSRSGCRGNMRPLTAMPS